MPNKAEKIEEQIKFLKMLREELENGLRRLSKPSEGFP
jgi:hypothetical protein